MSIDWNDRNKRKALRLMLQRVYPDYDGLEGFVDEELDENLAEIASGQNVAKAAHALVKWMRSRNRLDEVFEAFSQENPNDSGIKELQTTPIVAVSQRLSGQMCDMPQNAIFISYRRSDSSEAIGRIYDFLSDHFGNKSVFKDVDSIPLGIDFRTHLNETIGECSVLISVIGPTWLEALQERLNQSSDWVRTEISAALERGIPVVPLLVGGAQLPKALDLPEDLQDLAYRNAITVRPDPDFKPDINRLIRGLEAIVASASIDTATSSDTGTLHVPDRLSGDEYDELVEALISAFPNEESLALMVKRSLRQPLNMITQGASSYEATVDSLIEWAESRGKLAELVEGALKKNPGNSQLNRWVKIWRE